MRGYNGLNKSLFMQGKLDAVNIITEKFGNPIETAESDKIIKVWKTQYGFELIHYSDMSMFVFYKYDKNLPFYPKDSLSVSDVDGLLETVEILNVLEQLEKDPKALYIKPPSILLLEEKTTLKACMKLNKFGSWHLWDDGGEISMFNNPFCVTSGYTDAEDVFEIWFTVEERNPREYVGITEVLQELTNRGLNKK